MQNKEIYLDHGASTPVHPQVLDVMLPYWTESYGNPSSHHAYGHSAQSAVQKAKQTIAGLLTVHPKEIHFTGCGSESDNLALRGLMWSSRQNDHGNHLIISQIEHSAIKQTALRLRDLHGFDLTILPVDQYGQVRLSELKDAIRPDTVLISIMAAQNEIGTLQPVESIGEIARDRNIIFHTDAIQAVAAQRWDLSTMPIDMLSIAPHKFYGPKGIGLIYIRNNITLEPIITGGGQENGLRAGTENVPYIVGSAESLRLAYDEMPELLLHYQQLRDKLIEGVLSDLPQDAILTGHPQQRLPHNASFAFRNISGNDLLMHLDLVGIAASSGSACKSGNPRPSATLEALGLSTEWTKGGLRITVGRQNTISDIDHLLSVLPKIVKRLKNLVTDYA